MVYLKFTILEKTGRVFHEVRLILMAEMKYDFFYDFQNDFDKGGEMQYNRNGMQ